LLPGIQHKPGRPTPTFFWESWHACLKILYSLPAFAIIFDGKLRPESDVTALAVVERAQITPTFIFIYMCGIPTHIYFYFVNKFFAPSMLYYILKELLAVAARCTASALIAARFNSSIPRIWKNVWQEKVAAERQWMLKSWNGK
jgi:hypothetical protein